jgi:hypothetical protein
VAKQIVVTLSLDGSITAESAGVRGPQCLDDLVLIEGLVQNATVVDSKLTPNYFNAVSVEARTHSSYRAEEQDHA